MSEQRIATWERWCLTALTVLVLFYLVLRAAMVPFTHDEARTFQQYVLTGEFLPFASHWDAGNHLLLTALAQVSFKLFGAGMLSMRMWSLLAFVLYACYVWRMGSWIRARTVRWCMWAALLLMPFMIEFFALFRGYGLGMAFLAMALYHGVAYMNASRTRDLALALLAILLASMAMLSLLIVWCTILGMLLLCVITRSSAGSERVRTMLLLLFLGIVPLMAAAYYSSRLAAMDLLYFGSPDGLVSGTFFSLGWSVLGIRAAWFAWALFGASIAAIAFAVRVLFIRERTVQVWVLLFCAGVLAAECMGRVVLGEGFAVLYPTDRTAMHYLPLLILLFALALDRLPQRFRAARYVALVLLFLPLRTITTANIDHTSYWPEEAIPNVFFDLVSEQQQKSERPLLISAYHQQPPCWAYGNMLRGGHLNQLESIDFPNPWCDMLLLDTTFKETPDGFHTIARAPSGHNNLLLRDRPLVTNLLFDSVLATSSVSSKEEFIPLLDLRSDSGFMSPRIFEVETPFSSSAPAHVWLVMEVRDASGKQLLYTHTALQDLRARWNNDTLRVAQFVPAGAVGARTAKIYLWNRERGSLGFGPARVRIRSIEH